MNVQSDMPTILASQLWLDQLFSSRAALTGGVVRRKARDVHRMVGRARLEHEVRKRGFHMVKIGDQYVILCNRGDLTLIC
jgi:hypothetical protein